MNTLICINDKPSNSSSLIFGKSLASALKSEISILLIRPKKESPSIGQNLLIEASKFLLTSPSNQIICSGDDPAAEILSHIGKHPYDLVILDATQQFANKKFSPSTIIQRVITQTDTSPIIVREPCNQINHILVTTSGTPLSETTVHTGADIAHAASASLTLLHVTDYFPGMYIGMSQIDETLSELLQTDTPLSKHLIESANYFRSRGIEAHIELRHGLVEAEILRSIERGNFDLLVLGKSLTDIFHKIFMPELSQSILDKVICPVLIVHHPIQYE